MKRIVFAIVALGLAGCTGTDVLPLGPNRYRVTQEAYAAATAETSVITQARAFCSARNQQADVRLTDVRPSVGYSYASASAEFSCLDRLP